MKKFLTILFFPTFLVGRVLFLGNGTGTTFSTPVGQTATFSSGQGLTYFYTTAGQAAADNTYAVARVDVQGTTFQALAPAEITFNNEKTTNPLCGAQIDYIALSNSLPTVVKHGETRLISYFGALEGTYKLGSTGNLLDAAGLQAQALLGLCSAGGFIIVPVTNNAGDTFGATGSGIALAARTQTEIEQVNAESTSDSTTAFAAALNNTSDTFKITNNVTITSNEVDCWYDYDLQRFYVAVQVQSNAGASSGARAIAVGRITNGKKIIFSKLVSDAALSGANNNIIGTGQSSQTVSILKVRTMKTSTKLNYLIVLGGNGAKTSVGNTVYALPLVNYASQDVDESTQGTLAAIDQEPTDYYNNGKYFTGRSFRTPPTTNADLYTSASVPAQVGGGPLPIQASDTVSDFVVYGDTVFASSSYAYAAGKQPGIFASTALFDDEGRIKSWTPWQLVGGSDDQVYGLGVNFFYGNLISVTNNSLNVSTMSWNQGSDDGMIATLESLFPQEEGGIQNLLDFPTSTTAFSDFSMLIATGLRRLALIESGSVQGGFFKPTTGDYVSYTVSFDDGATGTIPASTKMVFIEQGALNTLDSISSATIATNTGSDKSWIVAGGVGGLVILADNNGNCFSGTISSLSEIPANLSFKVVGNFPFVQKVFTDNTYLYVLTVQGFYRIVLDATAIKNNNLSVTTLATAAQFGSFQDALVSGPLALLATARGLVRSGDGTNITTVTGPDDAQWTRITVPDSVGPIVRLVPSSTTDTLLDSATNGQLHVLCSYIGYNLSTVNRFALQLTGGAVDDNSVLPLPDLFIKNTLSYIIDFSEFRNSYASNTSFNQATVSKDVNNVDSDGRLDPAYAEILRPFISSGTNLTFIDAKSLINFPSSASIINTPIFIRSASGGMMVAGDFGVYAND